MNKSSNTNERPGAYQPQGTKSHNKSHSERWQKKMQISQKYRRRATFDTTLLRDNWEYDRGKRESCRSGKKKTTIIFNLLFKPGFVIWWWNYISYMKLIYTIIIIFTNASSLEWAVQYQKLYIQSLNSIWKFCKFV